MARREELSIFVELHGVALEYTAECTRDAVLVVRVVLHRSSHGANQLMNLLFLTFKAERHFNGKKSLLSGCDVQQII